MKYYSQLKYMDDGCPRRNLFTIREIAGVKQFYPMKKRYIRWKLYNHIAEKFNINMPSLDDEWNWDRYPERLAEVNKKVRKLTKNMDEMIEQYDIEVTDLQGSSDIIIEQNDEEETVRFHYDALGTFEGDKTIFTINTSSRSKTDNLRKLAFMAVQIGDINIDRVIELKLGSGKYRESPKEGDRNKDGSLSKRGLKPWETIAEKVMDRIQVSMDIIDDMVANPNEYNQPEFGTCGTCPYHNVEIEFNDQTIRCIG